jgi:hypothetical protein
MTSRCTCPERIRKVRSTFHGTGRISRTVGPAGSHSRPPVQPVSVANPQQPPGPTVRRLISRIVAGSNRYSVSGPNRSAFRLSQARPSSHTPDLLTTTGAAPDTGPAERTSGKAQRHSGGGPATHPEDRDSPGMRITHLAS